MRFPGALQLTEHTGGAQNAHQGCSQSTPNKNPSELQPNGSAEAEAAVAASASKDEVVEATQTAVTNAAETGIEQSSGETQQVIEAEVVGAVQNQHPTDAIIEAEVIDDDGSTDVVDGILVREDQVPNEVVPVVEWAYDRDTAIEARTAPLPRGVNRDEFLDSAALYRDLRTDLPNHAVDSDDIKTYAGKVLGAYVTWRKLNLGVEMLPKWRGDVVKMVKALLKDGWSPMASLDVVMHWHDRSMTMVRDGRDPLAPGAIRSIAQGFLEANAGAALHGVDGTGRTAKQKHADDVDAISGAFAEAGW